MYRSARLRVAAASAAIVCLLFSQLAVASFDCPALLRAAVTASAPEPADHADEAADHCAGNDAARSGLCQAHCSPAQLSLSQPQTDAPPLLLVAAQPRPLQREPVLQAAAPPFGVPLRSHSPPHAILHCCFRI